MEVDIPQANLVSVQTQPNISGHREKRKPEKIRTNAGSIQLGNEQIEGNKRSVGKLLLKMTTNIHIYKKYVKQTKKPRKDKPVNSRGCRVQI